MVESEASVVSMSMLQSGESTDESLSLWFMLSGWGASAPERGGVVGLRGLCGLSRHGRGSGPLLLVPTATGIPTPMADSAAPLAWRMQLSHCCLLKASLAWNEWDWSWPPL